MDPTEVVIGEFLTFNHRGERVEIERNDVPPTPQEAFHWTRLATIRLIETFGLLSPKMGTLLIKRKKDLWVEISKVIGGGVTPSLCENKWKVLIRNYKDVIDNNRKTGRTRKTFEYMEFMDHIFNKKRNVNPELLLTANAEYKAVNNTTCTNTIQMTVKRANCEAKTPDTDSQPEASTSPIFARVYDSGIVEDDVPFDEEREGNTPPRPKRNRGTRRSVLEAIRQDKNKYYVAMLAIHRERLDVEKEKLALLKHKMKCNGKGYCVLPDSKENQSSVDTD